MAVVMRHRGLFVALALMSATACSPGEPATRAAIVGSLPAPVVGWFLNPNQQARIWFEAGEPARAARLFEDRLWKGLALVEADDLESAATILAGVDTARGQFELGNAWARLERLPEAALAYQRALELRGEFPEARFNLRWVEGLLELEQKEYDDAGGTGGQLEADKIVFDERGARGEGEMTLQEAQAQGMSDAQLRELWMRRVETTPGEFLRLKFSYQAQSGATQ